MDNYLKQNQKKGVFIYTSDHGDTVGEHDIFGKQTFYEGSSRIPLIFAGSGIKANNKIKSPASIMDIGQTLCDLTGSISLCNSDGISLLKEIKKGEEDKERYVLSEFIERYKKELIPGRMVRKGKWKLISYFNYDKHDLLFNLENDPHELNNLQGKYLEIEKKLKEIIYYNWNIKDIKKKYKHKRNSHKILSKWGEKIDFEENERWRIPGFITKINEDNFI